MPITFTCKCGEPLVIDDQYAGMDVECPDCTTIIRAPESAPLAVAKPVTRERKRATAEIDDDRYDDDDDDDDRPIRRRRKPKPKRKKEKERQSLEGKVWSGSAIGGLIAMLIAVAWFVGGLFAGFIFFYPPILFIIGLVGLIRGLMAGGDD